MFSFALPFALSRFRIVSGLPLLARFSLLFDLLGFTGQQMFPCSPHEYWAFSFSFFFGEVFFLLLFLFLINICNTKLHSLFQFFNFFFRYFTGKKTSKIGSGPSGWAAFDAAEGRAFGLRVTLQKITPKFQNKCPKNGKITDWVLISFSALFQARNS